MRLHRVFEEEAVFRLLDGRDVGADQDDVVFFQNAAVGKFDRQIERSLSAHGRQHGETRARRHFPLDADNLFQIFKRERFDVGAVGNLRVGHDGRRIGVGQHHLIALRLERLASLRARVVKLRRLPDDDGPGAENQDFRDVSAFGHLCFDLHGLKISWTLGPCKPPSRNRSHETPRRQLVVRIASLFTRMGTSPSTLWQA